MTLKANKLSAEILQIITERYVVTNAVIPADILKLKDETMNLYEKSRKETNVDVLSGYERRLEEIRALVCETYCAPPKG